VLVGSLVLGALYETGYLWLITQPLSPVVEGWLGLPAVAGLALLFAILRKELALQLLVVLAIVQYGPSATNLLHFMTVNQLFVYALVNTLYIPCVATVAVLGRELGWKRAIPIMVFTVGLAVFVGGIATRVLGFFA
jgi:ferrous iron transport protein B